MILEILNETSLYKDLKDIVPKIMFNSCHNEHCSAFSTVEPIQLFKTFTYPSLKFTFSFPNIITGAAHYNFGFFLTKEISCRLLLEDKERFTRRLVIWTKELGFHDQTEIEFYKTNESTVYEFALTLR